MHRNGYSLALMGAVYGLLGFFMVQLALAACYLVVWYALAGNFAAVVFIFPAAAAFFVAYHAIRGTASAMRATS